MRTRRLETALTAALSPLVTAAVLALHNIAMHRVSCSPGHLAHLLCYNGLWQGDGHLKLVRVFRVTAGPVTSRSGLHRQADASNTTQGSIKLHRELGTSTWQVLFVIKVMTLLPALTASLSFKCPCRQLLNCQPTNKAGLT